MGFTAPQELYLHFSELDAVGDHLDPGSQFCCIHLQNDDNGQAVVWTELSSPHDGLEVDVSLVPGGLGDTAALLAEEESARTDLLAEVDAAFAGVEWSQPTTLEQALVLPAPESEGEELALLIRLTSTDVAGVRTSDCCLIDFAGMDSW